MITLDEPRNTGVRTRAAAPRDGYALRAWETCGADGPFWPADPAPESRDDFLRAVEMLADAPAAPSPNRSRPDRQEALVSLSCSYERWVYVFGPPQTVETHYHPFLRATYETWVHACADGLVSCTGQLGDRDCPMRTVTLSAVRIYRTDWLGTLKRMAKAKITGRSAAPTAAAIAAP